MTGSTVSMPSRSILARRVGAYMLDILLLFVVLGPLGFAVQQFTGLVPETGPEIWRALLLNFSLPVWLYFMICESSARGTTIGKLLVGLRVEVVHASKPLWPCILLRTAIKLAPWELVHIASFGLAPADGSFTMLQASLLTLAWLLMVMYLFRVWRSRGRLAPHDRIAGTQVVAIENQCQR